MIGVGRDFMLCWTWETAERELERAPAVLESLDGRQLQRVEVGDTIWIVTIPSMSQGELAGRLTLVGRMRVGTLDWRSEGRQQWAHDVPRVRAEAGTAESCRLVNLLSAVADLRFITKLRSPFDRLQVWNGRVNPFQLNRIRHLTPESAALLNRLWQEADLQPQQTTSPQPETNPQLAPLRVFVSHSHQDNAFTQRLVTDLERAGTTVWWDISGIDHGDFMVAISDALRRCEWFVLVLTPAALSSPFVRLEVDAALVLKYTGRLRGVIRMLAAPCSSDAIPPLLEVMESCDATVDYDRALDQLLQVIGLRQRPIQISQDDAPSAPPVSDSADSNRNKVSPKTDKVMWWLKDGDS